MRASFNLPDVCRRSAICGTGASESVRSLFYEDLKEHVETRLADSPRMDRPVPSGRLSPSGVDWSLTCNNRDLFLFGVRGGDKAKNVAISLLEFQKARLPFISLVVHEDMQDLGRRELSHLTRNADKQYPELGAFREYATQDIPRLAGVVPLMNHSPPLPRLQTLRRPLARRRAGALGGVQRKARRFCFKGSGGTKDDEVC